MSNAQAIETPIRRPARRPRVDPKIASRVAEALSHAEFSLDQAFIATAELTILLPSVRGQTNLAFCVPQDAIEAGTVTIASITKARSDLQHMHAQLAQLRDRLRLPATAEGPNWWKFGEGGPEEGEGGG